MKEIAQKHFPDIEFNYVDKRKGDVMMTKARTAPLRKLGWKTEISIKKGINECFANLKEK